MTPEAPDVPREPTARREQIVLGCLREADGDYVSERTLNDALTAGRCAPSARAVIDRMRGRGWVIDRAPAESAAKGYRLHAPALPSL
jgi:hypothetical protein